MLHNSAEGRFEEAAPQQNPTWRVTAKGRSRKLWGPRRGSGSPRIVGLRLSRVQGSVWVGNARRLGQDCLPRRAVTTQKTVASSRFRSAFDSLRGDLETFSGQSFPARPGQGDGAGPCRRRAGRAIPQRRIARRPVVRSGPAKGRGNRGKIVTRRAEICGPHRTMPPRRSAGSGRDGGRRTWGAGTGGAESSGRGPVQPAHE